VFEGRLGEVSLRRERCEKGVGEEKGAGARTVWQPRGHEALNNAEGAGVVGVAVGVGDVDA
jgi:hypothetical protein